MSWRLAKSLETLRSQVNAAAPNRNKASDGTIGDAAHAAVKSEHNPNGAGVVTAIDITHDAANGADMNNIAASIINSGDSRFWYIIFAGRIYERGSGWTKYYGANQHYSHMHLSTDQRASYYDDGKNWSIASGGSAPAPAPVPAGSGSILRLPASAPTWRIYPLGKPTVVGNEVGFLRPAQFGGLEYQILERPSANVAIIQTRDFGKVQIWIAPDTGAQVINGAAPAPVPTPPKGQTLYLPPVPSWAVYRYGSGNRKGTSDQVGSLRPVLFGGLTYNILENRGNFVVIQTRDYGKVQIWVAGTEAVIR